ncbi:MULTISPECIES: caspase family protein [Henriciella]|uniref:Caspase family p20 domain-containing protein n=1 Tax=Henriciella pelagia TaxID=1977912 RepID=A0ABQ1JCF0_9PROT|nr:caspase family protein [Henriciella pelagia]GGB65272.1 hypothetical protein GCM10011503_12630 [Henriciella pelagia]
MRTLLSVLGFLVLVASPATAQRIATIVGNADYERPGWTLANPHNDSRLVADALKAVGFETELVFDVDEKGLEDAFIRHAQKLKDAGPASTGFFYYAGHAVQSEGINYLIPVDASPRSEADIWAQAPRLGQLLELLETASNDVNFVVLDACRDNPLPAAARSGGSGLAPPSRLRGILIAYATAPGMTAADGKGSNSPFSRALALNLVQPGIAAEAMFRRVATQVEEQTGYSQQPWTESGLRGEADFCFAGCDRAQDAASVEIAALQLAVKSESADLLESFLSSYPGAEGRGLVEARIAELRKMPGPARALRIEAAVDALSGPDAMPVDVRMLRAIIQRLADSEQDIDAAVLNLIERRNLHAAVDTLWDYYDDNKDHLQDTEAITILHRIGAFAVDADMPMARQAYERLIDLDPEDYYAHLRLVRLSRFEHDVEASRRYLQRARALSPGRAEDEIFLDIQEGSIRVYEDRLVEAGEILLDAARRAEADGFDRLVSQARTNAALSFAIRGEHEKARAMLAELMPWQTTHGFDRDLGVAYSTMGNMAELDGDLEAARGFFENYLNLEQQTGRPESLANGYRQLASIDLKLGNTQAAEAGFSHALKTAREEGSPVGQFFSLLGLAEVQSALGDGEGACATVSRAELLYADDMRISPTTLKTIEALGCTSKLIEVSALE